MKRRQALLGIAGLSLSLGVSKASKAQGTKRLTVGLLDGGERLAWWAAFRDQMAKLGYIEAKNIAYESRFARSKLETLPALAQQLVALKVTVIVTAATVASQAARRATDQIPIVTATGADHVSMGFAASLARPGGNVTGLSTVNTDLTGKRLELLREILPKLSRLAVLWQAESTASTIVIRDLEHAARASNIALQTLGVRKPEDLAGAFSAATRERAEAMFVVSGPLTIDEGQQISEFARKHRMPVMGPPELVELGTLASYGANIPDLFRRAALYVDKILKGAKPGDLPIEQASKFEMAINRKTAKALGIAIPQTLLVRADKVY